MTTHTNTKTYLSVNPKVYFFSQTDFDLHSMSVAPLTHTFKQNKRMEIEDFLEENRKKNN